MSTFYSTIHIINTLLVRSESEIMCKKVLKTIPVRKRKLKGRMRGTTKKASSNSVSRNSVFMWRISHASCSLQSENAYFNLVTSNSDIATAGVS